MTRQESARTAGFTITFAVVAWLAWMLRDVLVLIGFSALLALALDPVIVLIERIRTPWGKPRRMMAAALVMLALVAGGGWGLAVAVPRLAGELGHFAAGAPASLERLLTALRDTARERGMSQWLGPLGGDSPMTAGELLKRAGTTVIGMVGVPFGSLGYLVGMAFIPMLAFYLLAEGEAVERSALEFFPDAVRPRMRQVLATINRALRSYVRGQSVICLLMGALVAIALLFLHYPVAVLLGTIVAVAEIVPILGFWTASLAIVLAGWGLSPMTALWGFVAYLAINQMVSLLVTPRVLGRHMELHPFVVSVSILAGGTLLGAAGALLALPVAAAIQSAISEFARRPGGAHSIIKPGETK